MIAFSPDGHLIATSSSDCTIRLWQVKTGNCIRTLAGHSSDVLSVAFAGNGAWLVSGSADETLKVWDTQSGECLQTIRPDQPYARLNITGITGVTAAQKANLKALGAIETDMNA